MQVRAQRVEASVPQLRSVRAQLQEPAKPSARRSAADEARRSRARESVRLSPQQGITSETSEQTISSYHSSR